MLNLPLSGIKKIEAIVQGNEEYISLSQGALKLGGIPQQIKDHLQIVLKTDKTDYYQSGWGIYPLREKIAQNLSTRDKTKITPDQVMVTHGCTGALSSLFLTLLDKDDQVIIPEPTYPAYDKLTQLVGCEKVFISMLKDNNNNKNDNWELNLEKIKKATTKKTKIIIFSNPWNPLGIIVPEKILLELIDWCDKNQIYLIIDEAYDYYTFDKSFVSSTKFINQSKFLIKVASFSKNMAMSGWRVGYLVADKDLIEILGKTQDALINCPNVPAQYAAMFSLDHPEFTDIFNHTLKENLILMEKILNPLVKEKIFEYQKPQGGIYLFLKSQNEDATDLCMNILNNAKVSLIPGKYFGDSGKAYLRLCFSREKEILEEGLKRVLNFFL